MEKILLTRVCSTDALLDGTDKPYVYYSISRWVNNEWDVFETIGSYKEVKKKYPNISERKKSCECYAKNSRCMNELFRRKNRK